MDDTQLLLMLGIFLVVCCWLTLRDFPYSFVCNGVFMACCWVLLRDAIKETEMPLAVQCSQVMEKMFEDPEQRAYVSDYGGVDQDKLVRITTNIVVNCSLFFDGPSVVSIKTVADHSNALARALNASMTEESREWWLRPLFNNNKEGLSRARVSYWMMQIILSSHRSNLLRGRATGYKRWYYPGSYEALWSMQSYRKTRNGSWFNATKKILAEILEAEAARYAAGDTTEPADDITSLTAEIQVRMLREEAMRVYFQEKQRAMKGRAMNGI
jgi:hypothetical protein